MGGIVTNIYLEWLYNIKGEEDIMNGNYFLALTVQYLSASAVWWVIGLITFFFRKKNRDERSLYSNVAGDLSIMIILGILSLLGNIYTGNFSFFDTVPFFAIFTFGIFSFYKSSKKSISDQTDFKMKQKIGNVMQPKGEGSGLQSMHNINASDDIIAPSKIFSKIDIDANPQILYCQMCGNKLIIGSRYCDKCGVEINPINTESSETMLIMTQDDEPYSVKKQIDTLFSKKSSVQSQDK